MLCLGHLHLKQLLLSWRESLVNFLHDPRGPLNTSFDELVRSRTSLRTSEQVVSGAHVQASQDCSHNPDGAFAPFVHASILCIRLFVRLETREV